MSVSAQRAVELFRAAVPAKSRPATPLLTFGPAKSRAQPVPASWAEAYPGRVKAARAFLERNGVAVTRIPGSDVIPRWMITGSKQSIGNEELLQLAASRGWA